MSRAICLPETHAKSDVRYAVAKGLLPAIALVLRIFVGSVFLWSSLPKLQQPYDFLSAVYNYELVGRQLGFWVAAAAPWLEFVTGVCLVLGIWRRGAWTMAIVLLSVFTAAQASVAYRGIQIPCGCAPAVEPVSIGTVITSGLLALAAIAGLGCSLTQQFGRNFDAASPRAGKRA